MYPINKMALAISITRISITRAVCQVLLFDAERRNIQPEVTNINAVTSGICSIMNGRSCCGRLKKCSKIPTHHPIPGGVRRKVNERRSVFCPGQAGQNLNFTPKFTAKVLKG